MARQLYQARRMQTPDEFKRFEEARTALFSTGDPAVLSDLFAAFDDSTEQHEVMWGLVHDVEAFAPDIYLRELAVAAPKMLPHAKGWVEILHYRILNSIEYSSKYREIIPTLPSDTQKAVKRLLEEIVESEPEYRTRVQNLLNQERP